MWERQLGVVHEREKLRPVVLVVVHKRAKALVNPLVHVFGLAVGLRVGSRRQLDLSP